MAAMPESQQHTATTLEDVTRILTLINKPPNWRETRKDGDMPGLYDFWFDGGAARYGTGVTIYEFYDGFSAWVPNSIPGHDLYLTIQSPSGGVTEIRERSES